MCKACEREYYDPADRRYHAQPIACLDCGPRLWFISEAFREDHTAFEHPIDSNGETAIRCFHARIAANEIVAVKGIGGFHLACAASSSIAIQKLRERKGRSDKPLAVMVASLAEANRIALLCHEDEQLLQSPGRPIVLVRRRTDCDLSELVAPGTKLIGLMLPYSPLHWLLVQQQTLVMTSGNISDEPIVRTNRESFERLRSLADSFLLHNRDIHAPCDDSVMSTVCGRKVPIRRSRGYAPQPVRLNRTVPSVLATGSDLKNTFCLTKNDYAYLSPHIGDMTQLESLAAFQKGIDHAQRLFRIEPALIACDMHPSYLSSRWAQQHAEACGLPLVKVQHHHAHKM